jgi:uncharacterized protein (TIGR00369 family)
VRKSFDLQQTMHTIGISIDKVGPGFVELSMPYRQDYTQQHGFIHAGITTTALDSACAYSAFSLMPAQAAVLTVEFKSSLLAPAKGDSFKYRGNVIKSGRTLSFTEGTAWAIQGDKEVLVASMTATIMALAERPDLKL